MPSARAPRAVRAGPLRAEVHGTDLRYGHVGGVEVIRRLHVAVRDASWRTLPADVHEVALQRAGAGFTLAVRAHASGDALDIEWRATAEGDADGSITYELEATVGAGSRYNRLGVCLLLPPRPFGGRPATLTSEAGRRRVLLPDLVAPQTHVDGRPRGLFVPFTGLDIEPAGDVVLRCRFEGDRFELEDQRNWGDGSFKVYSTPLAEPYPRTAEAPIVIRQRVELRVVGGRRRHRRAMGIVLRTSRRPPRPLPTLAIDVPPEAPPPGRAAVGLLQALAPDELRVALDLGADGWQARLSTASALADAVGSRLAVVLTLDDPAVLPEVAGSLACLSAPPARLVVLGRRAVVTPPALLDQARSALATVAGLPPVGAGTSGSFVELNRERPAYDAPAALVFAVSPQVHADDERSVVEALEAMPSVVATARSVYPGVALYAEPVTLQPPGRAAEPEPRQWSPFLAAWIVGFMSTLVETGVAGATLFAVGGPAGLVDAAGVPAPALDTLVRLQPRSIRTAAPCDSTAPLVVRALVVDRGRRRSLVAANLTGAPRRATWVAGDETAALELPPYGVVEMAVAAADGADGAVSS